MLTTAITQSGCGIISVLGTPTRAETKIKAEYNLSDRKEEKILVLVEEAGWLGAEVNLRYHLTKVINKNLEKKIGFQPQYLVDYSTLSEFRANQPDFSQISPIEIGNTLDANMVLLITIEDYTLNNMAQTDYFSGMLIARAKLLDTKTKEILWPAEEKTKNIKVGFDVEAKGETIANARLTTTMAHCITRYLYNCPKNNFKTADDRATVGWKQWKN